MELIKMQNPIAELDGDEMTRIIWKQIKDILLLPFVELNTEYYDLSLENRGCVHTLILHAGETACKYGFTD